MCITLSLLQKVKMVFEVFDLLSFKAKKVNMKVKFLETISLTVACSYDFECGLKTQNYFLQV